MTLKARLVTWQLRGKGHSPIPAAAPHCPVPISKAVAETDQPSRNRLTLPSQDPNSGDHIYTPSLGATSKQWIVLICSFVCVKQPGWGVSRKAGEGL